MAIPAAFGTTIHCARCGQPTTVGEIYPHAAPAKTPVRRKQVASTPVHEPPSRPSMTFYYDGLNTKGYPVSGEIDEATRKEARARLEKMGYRSLRVTGKPPKKRTSKPRLTKRDRRRARDRTHQRLERLYRVFDFDRFLRFDRLLSLLGSGIGYYVIPMISDTCSNPCQTAFRHCRSEATLCG